MLFEEIYNWIVYTGGICPTDDNHFGGPPGVTSELNLLTQQRPSELASCIEFFMNKKLAGEELNYYAEIGACAGGTTRCMYNFLKFKELLIIDDNGAENIGYVQHRGNLNRDINLKDVPRHEIIGSSNEQHIIHQAILRSRTQKYDMLFIDGLHSYEGVKSDTINYFPIVRQGGYIIFHDTASSPNVTAWVDEIPSVIPNLKKVAEFQLPDQYTPAFANGIGLTVFQNT